MNRSLSQRLDRLYCNTFAGMALLAIYTHPSQTPCPRRMPVCQTTIHIIDYALCHFLLRMTAVTACLIVVPARSISLFDNALVTHTFSAGRGCHSFSNSRGETPRALGIAFRRVMRTPLARAWWCHVSTREGDLGGKLLTSSTQSCSKVSWSKTESCRSWMC